MSYQVLARKWRPKKFQDVIGQSHITRGLINAIQSNKIGHAYMLVGTRGVGKTTIARLFAKAIRCESLTADGNACNECKACLDFDTETSMNVIEIDGASNNSVDNIRELISNVHYLPTSGKYKVYIIDEVHMLSTNAFNALLKTLEEPPAHVVFIFATTEAQKLLGTVLSRCQRFDLRHVSVPELVAYIKHIARLENISFESDSLIEQLAVLGRGSVRDTLSLLDQVLTGSLNNTVSEVGLTSSLGVAGLSGLRKMLKDLYQGNKEALSEQYNKFLSENVPVKNIASGLLDELFKDLNNNKEFSTAELIWIYETMARETTWIFTSLVPEKAFLVLLYKVALRRSFFNLTIKQSQRVEGPTMTPSPEPVSVSAPVGPTEPVEPTPAPKSEVKAEVKKDLSWDGFLNFLSAKSPASASNLEQGNLTAPLRLEHGQLHIELGFGYSGEVFFDYLSEEEVFNKLRNNLADYFEVSKNQVFLNLKKVAPSDDEFISAAAIREQKEEISQQERMENFRNNPMLKEAEKVFNAKVDKVILENNKK